MSYFANSLFNVSIKEQEKLFWDSTYNIKSIGTDSDTMSVKYYCVRERRHQAHVITFALFVFWLGLVGPLTSYNTKQWRQKTLLMFRGLKKRYNASYAEYLAALIYVFC